MDLQIIIEKMQNKVEQGSKKWAYNMRFMNFSVLTDFFPLDILP